MGRASRRVHLIEVEGGYPFKTIVGGPEINHEALEVGQFIKSQSDGAIHEFMVTSVEPKRAKWVRVVGPTPPAAGMPGG